jgi:hypothetical protein
MLTMSMVPFSHTRATRNGVPMVLQLDQGSRVRLAAMRRDVATKLRLPVNNSTLVRLALARLMRSFEDAIGAPEDDVRRLVLCRDIAQANAGESLAVGEDFVLSCTETLSALIDQQHRSQLARLKRKTAGDSRAEGADHAA